MIARYKDIEALKKHMAGDKFKEIGKALAAEGLLAKPMEGYKINPVAGFRSRI